MSLPLELQKGLYKANIKTTVRSSDLNANLDRLVTAAGYTPGGMWADNGDGTASYTSSTIIVSDVLPVAPPTDVVYTDLGSGKYGISGKLSDTDTIAVLFVDDGASGFMEADKTTGLFSGEIAFAPRQEPYKVYMKAANVYAKYSEAVSESTIAVDPVQDTVPPVIDIVFPAYGYWVVCRKSYSGQCWEVNEQCCCNIGWESNSY